MYPGLVSGPDMPGPGVRMVGVYFTANGKFYARGGRSLDGVGFQQLDYKSATLTRQSGKQYGLRRGQRLGNALHLLHWRLGRRTITATGLRIPL